MANEHKEDTEHSFPPNLELEKHNTFQFVLTGQELLLFQKEKLDTTKDNYLILTYSNA